MNTKYHIIKKSYSDSVGEITETYYYIKYKKQFLFFFSFWKTVETTLYGDGGSFKLKMTFDSYDEAKKYIKNILCTKTKRETWSEETVDILDCND